MELEYEPAKGKTNTKKHGIDFKQATLLWNDAERIEFVACFADEPRLGLVGSYAGKSWTAVFTIRKERVRIISVRRARKNEEAIYHDSEGV